VARYGKLNVLYNNAGGSSSNDGPVAEAPIEEFWRAIKLDLFGTWLGCEFGIPHLINSGGGSIINAASMVGLMGWPGKDAYTPAKGGIAALTRSVAVQYASKQVRVNAVAPGVVRTERTSKRLNSGLVPRTIVDRHLLGVVEPIEIAYAALYFASDESRPVTGQILSVNSGVTIA
jgi:NAD(P)-dependent dehydrogenase (short-subunit alcohol dehydrogenase family)